MLTEFRAEMEETLVILIWFVSSLHLITGFTCPVHFEASGNKCYYFQGSHTSPTLAATTCSNLNSNAVRLLVESQDEANYVSSKLQSISSATHAGAWTRCNDVAVDGQWTCDGSTNYWNSNADKQGFWEWNTGDPGSGDCLILDYTAKLKKSSCQLSLSFNVAACEITMVTAAPATTSGLTTTASSLTQTAASSLTPTAASISLERWYHNDDENTCLQNHVLVTMATSGTMHCGLMCSANQACLSFNVHETGGSTSCTLNNAVRESQPAGDYVATSGCKYFYPI